MDWVHCLAQPPVICAVLSHADVATSSALVRTCRTLANAFRGSAEVRLCVWRVIARRGSSAPLGEFEIAAMQNDVAAVRHLLTVEHKFLTTPAFDDGWWDRLLRDAGVNAAAYTRPLPSSRADNALFRAFTKGSLDAARVLHEEFGTPLRVTYLGKSMRHIHVVRYLLGKQMPVTLGEYVDAADHKNLEALKLLHETHPIGGEYDARHIMVVALVRGSLDIARYLVETMGVAVSPFDSDMAERQGHTELATYLRGVPQ
jgi:hypothetical protein